MAFYFCLLQISDEPLLHAIELHPVVGRYIDYKMSGEKKVKMRGKSSINKQSKTLN